MQRAKKFGLDNEELDAEKRKARAERFGIETKEQQEQKKLDRMRRFGLDIKNKGGAQELTLEVDPSKSQAELDALKAKRLQRFGEVDPEDLKGKKTF